MNYLKKSADGVALTVYVQPRSSKNAVVGIHADALKVKLKAPPVDGAANKMCVEFVAKTVGLPKSAVEILSGHTSRTKRLLCRTTSDVESEKIVHAIEALVEKG
ncbi:MAG: YggU family protein [Desulfobacterales bacterium]|nr:YggU family protein [Desulfobacterales bacterium]